MINDLLPQLTETRPAHQALLRALSDHCLEQLAAQSLRPRATGVLQYSRQLLQQAAAEAACRPTRWHQLRAYLREALPPWRRRPA